MSKIQRDAILKALENQDKWRKAELEADWYGECDKKYEFLERYSGFYGDKYPPFISFCWLDSYYMSNETRLLDTIHYMIASDFRNDYVTNILGYVFGITIVYSDVRDEISSKMYTKISYDRKLRLFFIFLNEFRNKIKPDSMFQGDLLLASLFNGTYVLEESDRFKQSIYGPVKEDNFKRIPFNFIFSVMEEFASAYPNFDFTSLKDKNGNSLGNLLLNEFNSQIDNLNYDDIHFLLELPNVLKKYGADINDQKIGIVNILNKILQIAGYRFEPKQELNKLEYIIKFIRNFKDEIDFVKYGNDMIDLLEEYVNKRLSYLSPNDKYLEYDLIRNQLKQKLEEIKMYINIRSNPAAKDKNFLGKLLSLQELDLQLVRLSQFYYLFNEEVFLRYDNITLDEIDLLLLEKANSIVSLKQKCEFSLCNSSDSVIGMMGERFLEMVQTGVITDVDKYGLLYLEGILKSRNEEKYEKCPVNSSISDVIDWLKNNFPMNIDALAMKSSKHI